MLTYKAWTKIQNVIYDVKPSLSELCKVEKSLVMFGAECGVWLYLSQQLPFILDFFDSQCFDFRVISFALWVLWCKHEKRTPQMWS